MEPITVLGESLAGGRLVCYRGECDQAERMIVERQAVENQG
jgi:hypothetical protein